MSRFDRRLLASAAARRGVAAVALFGVLQVGAVIAAAALLAAIITGVFQQHQPLGALRLQLALFGVAVLARAALIFLAEGAGHRVATGLISGLRMRSLRALMLAGPLSLARHRTGELTTLLGSGIDRLDAYFARFVPQTIVAVVLPMAAIIYVGTVDWISAIILLATVPLIPLFMVLIGWMAERSTRQRWETFQLLGGHFLDVLQGLPTLRLFGRGPAQTERIRAMSRALRTTTMATLRIAFLSSFALELLASLGVALLAVTIAVRLIGGSLDLRSGLTVLILAPEVYLPLRLLAGSFHGSMEGLEAARRLFAIVDGLDGADARVGAQPPVAATTAPAIDLAAVTFAHAERAPLLEAYDLHINAGERVLVRGASGAGKTTLLSLMLGLLRPSSGRVLVDGRDVTTISADERGALFGWLPQRPHLFSGTIADNVRLGRPDASDEDVRHMLQRVGATFVHDLPGGIAAPVAERGATLSGGQRQRLALARTLLRLSPIVLLDEPLAHLDAASRAAVSAAIEETTRGRTVIVAAHAADLFPWVDRVITLGQPPEPSAAASAEPAGALA